MQAVTAVQQPCSNPSKSPETSRKVLSSEYRHLQGFCTHLKTPANLRGALAWRRSGVRVPSGPLSEPLVYAEYTQQQRGLAAATSPLDSYLTVTPSRQYILDVNVVWSPCFSAYRLPPRRLWFQTLGSPPSRVKSRHPEILKRSVSYRWSGSGSWTSITSLVSPTSSHLQR
jgi:hypothetical protein